MDEAEQEILRIIGHDVTAPRLHQETTRLQEEVQVDVAHVVMLAERSLVSRHSATGIVKALQDIARDGERLIPEDRGYDSLMARIERYVASEVGAEQASNLNIGRSRIDRRAAVARLFSRRMLLAIHAQLLAIARQEAALAQEHARTVMPGWTHLLEGEPWSFGHYLLGRLANHERHLQRIEEAFGRINLSALGGCALVGTSWPIDRRRVSTLLGHDGLVLNAQDASAYTTDWINELVAVCAMVVIDLGRQAGDFLLWSTPAYGLIEVDERLLSPSGYIGKSNLAPLETVRAYAGEASGWFASQVGISRGPTTTDGEVVYAKFVGDVALRDTLRCLRLTALVLGSIHPRIDRMRHAASASWGLSAGLVELIMRRHGLSYSSARSLVEALVYTSRSRGLEPTGVTPGLVDEVAMGVLGQSLTLTADEVREAFDPGTFVANRTSAGGMSDAALTEQFRICDERLSDHAEWADKVSRRIANAEDAFRSAVSDLLGEVDPS